MTSAVVWRGVGQRSPGQENSRTLDRCLGIPVSQYHARYPNTWVPQYPGTQILRQVLGARRGTVGDHFSSDAPSCAASRVSIIRRCILSCVSKIVTIAAYKGGVGKTTLALELAYLLDAPLVDVDWDRGGATRRWGYRHEDRIRAPLLDALAHQRTPRLVRGHGKADLVPSHPELALAQPSSEDIATALEKWAGEWGRPWVVVDTHPGGVSSTFGAMNAATVVLVPIQLATNSLNALEGMLEEAADYPIVVVPNMVPTVPPASAVRRLRELAQVRVTDACLLLVTQKSNKRLPRCMRPRKSSSQQPVLLNPRRPRPSSRWRLSSLSRPWSWPRGVGPASAPPRCILTKPLTTTSPSSGSARC